MGKWGRQGNLTPVILHQVNAKYDQMDDSTLAQYTQYPYFFRIQTAATPAAIGSQSFRSSKCSLKYNCSAHCVQAYVGHAAI